MSYPKIILNTSYFRKHDKRSVVIIKVIITPSVSKEMIIKNIMCSFNIHKLIDNISIMLKILSYIRF